MMQIKQNIKTNNQSRFLLISKSAELQDDITKMQENLELMRNLTPVESEHYNKDEVLVRIFKHLHLHLHINSL